jgi:DNA polymerase
MPPSSAHLAAESLLAFWSEAGIDAMLLDEAVDRIAAGRIAPPPSPVAPRPIPAPSSRSAAAAPVDVSAAVAEAQRLAQAAGDLAGLKAAIEAFEGYPPRFEGAARQAVFYRGDPAAPLMVIGEGPELEDEAQGAPFVGRAGQLLDRMLAAAGLSGRVFMTNTVFWRSQGNRAPSPAEQAACAPFVERAIELVKPQMLLVLGASSAKALLRKDEGILALRGRWHEWRSHSGNLGLPVMPTLHPALLLTQPAAKKKVWSDLLTATERLDRPERP